jgi:flagellar motor protein MotB
MSDFGRTQHAAEARVWPAFTDVLMTVSLILVFYLFAQVVVSSQTSAAMAAVARRQAALRRDVVDAIPPALRRDVHITEDGSLQRYTFADWILFDSAAAELKPQGMEVLAALGRVFRRHSADFSGLQVEGHTDDHKLHQGARFPSNWELSSARATSVVRFLEDRCGLAPTLLSATGYSEYHPADRRDSDEARSRNRRIEVVVVYSVAAASAAVGGQRSAGAPPAAPVGR